MHKLTLSVVIPAHNEAENLPETLAGLRRALDGERIPYEIIIVNDNSTDNTASVIQSFSQQDSRIRGISRRPPGGFGRAIRSGLDAVQGDAVVIFMADCSDHPEDALAYYRKLEEGYDCVFGSRFIKGGQTEHYPKLKLVVNRIVNKCIQWMFLCPFNDLTNAFKAYRTEVIQDCGPYRASHFNITIEMSLGALIRRYQIAQIPIGWRGRTAGVSKLSMMQMGRRYTSTLLKIIAERLLIFDDLMAERLALRSAREDRLANMEQRIQSLEDRFGQSGPAPTSAPDGTRGNPLPAALRSGMGGPPPNMMEQTSLEPESGHVQ